MPEAVICRFCHSDLAKNQAAGEPPGFWRAVILNLICPGLGAWRCGYRGRGAITMLILVGAITIGSLQVGAVLNKTVEKAMRTGNFRALENISSEVGDNVWFDIFFYGYIISFIDLWFLVANKVKTAEHKDIDESAQK